MEIEIAYPTYIRRRAADPRALPRSARPPLRVARRPAAHPGLWSIAAGGPEDPKTIADYESTITLLTEWLYIAAQMPHGTHAQQNVFRAVQRAGRVGAAWRAPVRGAKRLAAELRDRGVGDGEADGGLPSEAHFDSVVRAEAARQRRERRLPGPPGRTRPTPPPR